MKKLIVTGVCAILVAALPASAATRDKGRPTIRYSTARDAVLLSNPAKVDSTTVPVQVFGRATDTGTGVRSVSVTWLRCTYGDHESCTIYGTPSVETAPSHVALTCNSTRRSCTWSATAPTTPGYYWFTARAKDRANNTASAGILTLIVI